MLTIQTQIPTSDLAEFASLPDPCKREVRAWLRIMADLVAAPRIGSALTTAARSMGVSISSARRYYDDYRHTGDWRVLVDRRKYRPCARRLPNALIEYWQTLCELHQRKTAPAYRQLIREWRAGQAIPGYEVTPCDCGLGHPEGWGARNLNRHKPTRFELKAMREGLGAALAAHGPQIITTRVGLYVGSHFVIDDVTRDFKVILISNGGKIARIQELGILDLFSADRFAVQRRPEFTRDSDGKKDRIKEREMRFLIAAQLRNTGYSKRGSEYTVEGGTATIRKPLEQWLANTVDTAITVRRPGDTGKTQVIAGYWGSGGGNPKHKAALESHHNYLANESDALIAATGHDRNEPEWLHGLECITEDVINWMRKLPPERAADLRAPMLEYWQGLRLLADIDHQIAWRTKHSLEGWEQCGHTTIEFRRDLLRDEWLSTSDLLTLPPHEQFMLAHISEQYPAFRRARKLAPREVFAAGAQSLCKVPDHIIALMFCDRDLGDDLRQTKALTANGTLEIDDIDVEPGTMIFEGFVVTPDNETRRLHERSKYGIVCNPFDRDALWVYDANGAYLGTAARRIRVCQLDTHGMEHALGRRSHAIAELLTPMRDRHAGAVQAIAELQAHNARVKAGLPVTPEALSDERATAARIRNERSDINDFMPVPNPGSAPTSTPEDSSEEMTLADFLPDQTH